MKGKVTPVNGGQQKQQGASTKKWSVAVAMSKNEGEEKTEVPAIDLSAVKKTATETPQIPKVEAGRNFKAEKTTAKKPQKKLAQEKEVPLPGWVGDLLVFPRSGLKYAGKEELKNETQHKKDLDRFYGAGITLVKYKSSLNIELSGIGNILEDENCILKNPFPIPIPKQKEQERRASGFNKKPSTANFEGGDTEQKGWEFLRKICSEYGGRNGKDKISSSLFRLAKSLENSQDEDITKIVRNAAPKEVIPFLLQNFYEKNKELIDAGNSGNNKTATIFYKQALQAELFLLAWQMLTLEADNKKLDRGGGSKFKKNIDLLDISGDGKTDMISFLNNKAFTVKKVYGDNLAFPKEAAIYQYGAMLEKEGKLNIAEKDPQTSSSSLRYEGDEGPLSESQGMYWRSIEKRLREGGGVVELVAKHGSGKSEFVSRIEAKLDYRDPEGLNLDELLSSLNKSVMSVVMGESKDDTTSPATPFSPVTPNPQSPAAEKRRVSGIGIEKIKNNIRPFKIDLHSSKEEIEKLNSFITLQDSVLEYGVTKVLQDLKVRRADGYLGEGDEEKKKNLKFISKIKPIIFADEFYYFNEKQLGHIEGGTVDRIEEAKYGLMDNWARSGSTIVTLGASASLGKMQYECEGISADIKKEQEVLNQEGNKKSIEKARSFLYSFNGKNLKEHPVFFKVLEERPDIAETKESTKARKKKSNIDWRRSAQVEVSTSKRPAAIKVERREIDNREYLIRTAWCIKELGKFAPDNIQNCKEYANVLAALTPVCFEAGNHYGEKKKSYLWGELDNLGEIVDEKKNGKRGKFSVNKEELYRSVKTFIGSGLCDSFPSGKDHSENQVGSARTRISELKEELKLKQYQYDELEGRINDAIERFSKFDFDLEEPKSESAGLFEVVGNQLSLHPLRDGKKMQYILPHFKIDERSCTDKDIENILITSKANVVILPHKEEGSKELKCKIAYIYSDRLNVETRNLSEIDSCLEEINELKKKGGLEKEKVVEEDISLLDELCSVLEKGGEIQDLLQGKENFLKEINELEPEKKLELISKLELELTLELESFKTAKRYEEKDKILSFYDIDDAIGGDRKKAAVGVNCQIIHATDKNFLVNDDKKIPETFQEIEQNERRNRTDLDDIKKGSLFSKFVMPLDTVGVDIRGCISGKEIPQEVMRVIANNTENDDERRKRAFIKCCRKNSEAELVDKAIEDLLPIIVEDVISECVIDETIKNSVNKDVEESYLEPLEPTKLDMYEEGMTPSAAEGTVDLSSNPVEDALPQDDIGEEEEEMSIEMAGLIVKYREVDVQESDVVEVDEVKAVGLKIDDEGITTGEKDFDEEGELSDQQEMVDIALGMESKVPSVGVRPFSMSSLSRVASDNIFELVKFDLKEYNHLCKDEDAGKLVYLSSVYNVWEDVEKTIKKIIIDSALHFGIDEAELYNALVISQKQGGFGSLAFRNDFEDELDKEVKKKYIDFSVKFQQKCKDCGIFAPELDDEEPELVGFSLELIPSIIMDSIENDLESLSLVGLREKYNCDLDNKIKKVKKEIYGKEGRSLSMS